jgi:hypothetical protein
MLECASEGGAKDGVLEPLRVGGDGKSRGQLCADPERTTSELGRLTCPARGEEGVTEKLVGARAHRPVHATSNAARSRATARRSPSSHAMAGLPAALRLLSALLPRLLRVQHRAELAVLAVQLGDHAVAAASR